MDTATEEGMETTLNGYGDTLHFILQFLHTEGFASTEEVLLQEIEQKLPAVIERTIKKHGGAELLDECEDSSASPNAADEVEVSVGVQICLPPLIQGAPLSLDYCSVSCVNCRP
jgi:hypothetical protein